MHHWVADGFTLPMGMFFQGFPAPVDGNTVVMYHGTSRANAASILLTGFRRSPDGMLGPGVYLSRKLRKARYYPVGYPEHEKVVIEALVNVGRVIPINCKDHPRQKNWQDPRCGEVYDTAWITPGSGILKGSSEMDCVWDPKRITILSILEARPVQPGYVNGYGLGLGNGYGHVYGLGYGFGHVYGYGYGARGYM